MDVDYSRALSYIPKEKPARPLFADQPVAYSELNIDIMLHTLHYKRRNYLIANDLNWIKINASEGG